ncbi:MAG: mannosyl-3-phosphoglycerate phosphatase [Candidatus Bathyarchaeota archaeon]|nr:mannosyl-3-phosphoglycerate phosphatase [Candidatus Bathyarchaeota archaeon]
MNGKATKKVVFSDIDGTLIDEKYCYKHSQPIVQRLIDLNAKLVLCSSKTRAEIQYYREKLGIHDPFASENGAAIFIPKGYFTLSHNYKIQKGNFDVIELGVPYNEIRRKLKRIRKKSALSIVGFGDMTVKEIAKDSGLPIELALLAKQREYSEPFILKHGDEKTLHRYIEKENLSYTKGGRYYHLMGKHDKGKAVAILKEYFIEEFGSLQAFGVGDGPNDLSMLSLVDKPFFVKDVANLQNVWNTIISAVKTQ